MRPAKSVVFLLLLLLFTTAQGIRLKGELSSAFQRKLQEEKSSPSGGGTHLCGKGGQCPGTMENGRFTKEIKEEARHGLPGFHEDYYGPRNHIHKHH